MGTLASALQPIASQVAARPRVYVDANMPAGLVSFMRDVLAWDVLFVLEEPDLRRAKDAEHFERARELARTLITLDQDFSNDRLYPREVSPGVILCSAPDERRLRRLLEYINRTILRAEGVVDPPLRGRKITVTTDVLTASLDNS